MIKGSWGKRNHPTIKIHKSFYEAKIQMLFFVAFIGWDLYSAGCNTFIRLLKTHSYGKISFAFQK